SDLCATAVSGSATAPAAARASARQVRRVKVGCMGLSPLVVPAAVPAWYAARRRMQRAGRRLFGRHAFLARERAPFLIIAGDASGHGRRGLEVRDRAGIEQLLLHVRVGKNGLRSEEHTSE